MVPFGHGVTQICPVPRAAISAIGAASMPGRPAIVVQLSVCGCALERLRSILTMASAGVRTLALIVFIRIFCFTSGLYLGDAGFGSASDD